jgi:rhodanese-related sulfurtransferase
MRSNSRLLPLVGAYNFRDLGGYPTVDGNLTRWGLLYRSDTLHELTETDLEVLRDIGLASVIDLRTGAELERTGRGLLLKEPIRYFHLSVMQEETGEADRPAELAELDLASVYLGWLRSGRRSLVEALNAVGDPEHYPIVFHCAAGKDRTGVLAALVLDIVGVERSVIVEDYVLTATRLDLIRARQQTDPDTARRMDEAPHLFGADAETMEKFLNGLYEQHGGGRQWASEAGVSLDRLDAMSALLID